MYATADGTLSGSCSVEGITLTFDLDLRRGWNALHMTSGGGLRVVTAAIPADASWYIVNPLTLAAAQGR